MREARMCSRYGCYGVAIARSWYCVTHHYMGRQGIHPSDVEGPWRPSETLTPVGGIAESSTRGEDRGPAGLPELTETEGETDER